LRLTARISNPEHQTSNMKLLTHIPAWLKNKYLITLVIFSAIMLFFDKNDFFTQTSRRKELRGLEKSKAFYTTQIALESKELQALKSNPAVLEKYAREKYLMKRDNEDLFVIPEKPAN
jgi:cell division protein DivIC